MKKVLLGVFAVIALAAAYFYMGLRYATVLADSFQITMDEAKTIVDILSAIAQTAAIIIAGFWTYERFIKTREDYPYPDIQHRAHSCNLGNGYCYLSVFISVTNKGKTKLDLTSGKIFIRQVLPPSEKISELIKRTDLSDPSNLRKGINIHSEEKLFVDKSQRAGWRTLGEREWQDGFRGGMHQLEPGQTREIQFDFLFKEGTKLVEIITFLEFKKIGSWEYTSFHSIEK